MASAHMPSKLTSPPTEQSIDRDEIRRGLAIFHPPEDVVELRSPNNGKHQTIAGYFNRHEKLAAAVTEKIPGYGTLGTSAPAIYITIQKINPALLNRCINDVKTYAKSTTSDADAINYNWLPIDLDPVRPAGISSSDFEHLAAIERGREIRAYLVGQGFPAGAFVLADSGNGCHLLARIDLDASKENQQLCKTCLQALARRFNDPTVEVDGRVFNPARIWKLPGTVTRKGDPSVDRPHRMARILETAAESFADFEIIPRELLEKLAGEATGDGAKSTPHRNETRPPGASKKKSSPAKKGRVVDLAALIEQHDIKIKQEKVESDGRIIFELAGCPFDPNHNSGEAFLTQFPDGGAAFNCHHNSCKKYSIFDFAAKLEIELPEPVRIEIHPIEALRLILVDCDGAATKDGVGLSKRDAEDLTDIIKRIKSGETDFSKKEQWTVYNKMERYLNTQLSGYTLIKPAKKGEDSDSMATIMVDLAIKSGAAFWATPEGEGFITMQVNTHFEHHPLKSSRVKDFLSELLYGHDGRAATRNGITDAVNTLSARARFEGEVHEVFTRVAGHSGKIFIDLGNDEWSAVEITTEGWRIIPSEEVPAKFRRAKGSLPLPSPITGGTLDDLRRVLNVPVGSPWTLLRAWILQAFRPKGPYPVLIVDGEQGSGKSWLGRILRHVIDPNSAPLRRPPRSDHELMIAATNAHILAFDNLSTIPPWLADAFCVVSTGGGMSVRRLYTDDEEEIFNVQRPIILNSIAELTTRGDLLDRAILIHLPRITDEKRKSESDIFAELDSIGPGVLGAIFDIIAGGLRELPNVRLDTLPRMADFAKWATACEIATGQKPGEFMEVFNENQDKAKAELIENDMFASALASMVNAAPAGELEITSTLLLTTLENRCNIMSNRDRPDGWPRSGKGVRAKIRRIAPGLRAVGIDVSEGRDMRQRSLIFRRRT